MRAAVAAFLALTVVVGCGRVAQPQPPFIRVPEPVHDFSASQSGYDIVLAWTNPAHNIDGSPADNLFEAEITSDLGAVATPEVLMGKPQSYVLSGKAKDWVGVKRTFTLKIDTNRDKVSAPVTASVIPVDVPGAVSNLHANVDQRTITLDWGPSAGAAPADGYQVQRTDGAEPPQIVTTRSFRDSAYTPGATYTYVVTAARRSGSAWILGIDPQQVKVEAVDRTPPKAPTGLQIVASDNGAFITWNASEETDLAGYRLFRSDGPNADFHPVGPDPTQANSYSDPDYRPGFRYRVLAIDDSKNESPFSAIVGP